MGTLWSALKATEEDAQNSQQQHVPINYAFFHHDKTIHHVRHSKVMFIMRGLPGSGKSTTVASLLEKYPDAVVCSADDYFMVNGEYHFQANKLSSAHKSCQDRAEEACINGENVIIIDNTNVKQWEMTHYTKLAFEYNYVVILLEPQTSWRYDPEELARKNSHGVPVEVLRKKVGMFDRVIPIYYAWFINERDSAVLVRRGHQYFDEVFRAIPQFASYLQGHFNITGRPAFSDIYPPRQVENELHTTAFYAARGKVEGSQEYSQQRAVQETMGRHTQLTIVGFVSTPRTMGTRVKLTEEQLKVWGQDDYENKPKSCLIHSVRSRRGDILNFRDVSSEVGSHDDEYFRPTSGFGSRAHATLGVAPESSAVVTGLDLIEVVACEEEEPFGGEQVRVKGGTARYYGEGRVAVYLDQPIVVNALFSGKY